MAATRTEDLCTAYRPSVSAPPSTGQSFLPQNEFPNCIAQDDDDDGDDIYKSSTLRSYFISSNPISCEYVFNTNTLGFIVVISCVLYSSCCIERSLSSILHSAVQMYIHDLMTAVQVCTVRRAEVYAAERTKKQKRLEACSSNPIGHHPSSP